jgi:hypothetical protein
VEGTTTPGPSALLGHAPCSACGAAVRDGAPWCTLCLTPTASSEPVAPPAPAAGPPAALDPLTAPLADLAPAATAPAATAPQPAPAGWPCTTCGHPNALELSACAVCGSAFLARLAAEDAPSLVLPLLGDMRTLSRSHHLALAGAVLTGVLVVLVLLTLVGALLG